MARFLIGESSEILVGRGLPDTPLPERSDRRQAAILFQAAADPVVAALTHRIDPSVEIVVIELPDRDAAKTLSALEDVYKRLADHHIGRLDTIIGVGGGAATDVAGFVAATWMRGVESVLVPTTLLAAVDAAIGGKTAVNVGGKNLVGVFWHPTQVNVDLDVLDDGPSWLRVEGTAEILKAGYLGAPEILAAYKHHGIDAPLDVVVPAAIGVKAAIVDEDFREKGPRALLNLGHTIGHAVEFAAGIPHGHAVAIGLVAAGAVSERRLGFEGRQDLVALVAALGLPVVAPKVDPGQVLSLVSLDKKHDGAGLRMVLLAEVGRAEIHHVTTEDVAHGLAAVGL